jgi:peroxiredoxin Q/BCP
MTRLKAKDHAPEFDLPDQDGKRVTLSDYRGKKLLLYFYPKADTPGCTKQACSLRDAYAELGDVAVLALGISPDPIDKQKKFDNKHALGFPLLSDPDHVVAEKYGAWGEKKMYGKTSMGIVRSAFLIDENGTIVQAWYKVKPEDTVPNVKSALKAG